MSDFLDPYAQDDGDNRRTTNQNEYSVGDISRAIKSLLEGSFDYVRVRGELSGVKYHSSGHCYMTLKDDGGNLAAVCWRGSVNKLRHRPQEGQEVIASGRITTYGDQSKYQLIISDIELAGQGALLQMLEERRQKLAKEGLFEEARKRPLPFLPTRIGVITSPTGAVIRDILHRLNDRFPRHVLVWPAPVQGEGSADKIAAAITGMNKLDGDLRPDLIIVARGGGSLEDLWGFNEEIVVRAAAASTIPLISAVGHETDWTLIDYAADWRAPTPTAAAEKAVPVRDDLLYTIANHNARLLAAMNSRFDRDAKALEAWGRGLPKPAQLIDPLTQKLDERAERLTLAISNRQQNYRQKYMNLAARLTPPTSLINMGSERLARTLTALARATSVMMGEKSRLIAERAERLDANSYQAVLKRGYVILKDKKGQLVSDGKALKGGELLTASFRDDETRELLTQPPTGQKSFL